MVNAPATLNKLMCKLLYGSDSLYNYVHDVLTNTPHWLNHLNAIRDFLTRV